MRKNTALEMYRILSVVLLVLCFSSIARAAGPQITFAAVPDSVRPGEPATLSWSTTGASFVQIEGLGGQPLAGTMTVRPGTRTTYTLKAFEGAFMSVAEVTVNIQLAPGLTVSAVPAPIVQTEGAAGGVSRYTVSNNGAISTPVNLFQTGTFFAQSPTSFTLLPGASQIVTVTANALPAGGYDGAALLSGPPMPFPIQMPIKVLSAPSVAGRADAHPQANRIDITAPHFAAAVGVVRFTNSGTASLRGVLASDAAWLIPQSGLVSIESGETVSCSFSVDATRRSRSLGSEVGSLSLIYRSAALDGVTTETRVSSVNVVYTLPLGMSDAAPDALRPDEVALFIPGVGHVAGTVGTFVSDVTVVAAPGTSVNDARVFYRSVDAKVQKQTVLPLLDGAIALGDVVKNVFGQDAQVGTLQIRSNAAAKLLVSTSVFNSSNAAGTYGTALPLFRSDRSVPPGQTMVLTGLRSDATSHTNLFIQETSGIGAVVETEFLAADGSSMGRRTDTLAPFGLSQINSVVPAGAVAAELTNTVTGSGNFVAFATPVDRASGDNWAIVDWRRQFGYSGTGTVVVPIAGVLSGANNTSFRTDLAITNTARSAGGGTLRLITRSGDVIERSIVLGARQSAILNNVAGSFFGAPSGTVGFLKFLPDSGTFVMTSRTYTTLAGQAATFGTEVPTLSADGGLEAGDVRVIGGIDDASLATVVAARPATFRTNFGLLETSGKPVRVRVTLRYALAAGPPMQTTSTASRDYSLGPNEFLLLNGIATEILGQARRDSLGDLHGLDAIFQVLDGAGVLAVFTSSVDNGTGDSILRTE